MVCITERDKIVLKKIATRGWVSTKYLAQFFPTHQAMLTRLNLLKKNKILKSAYARDLLKYAHFKTTSIEYLRYFTVNSKFYSLTDEMYKNLGISKSKIGVTPDFLDTVKGSRTLCTRSDFACQVLSAERRNYNPQTILVKV